MTSFLGVPIRTHERVFGNLYVANRIDAPEFSATDQALLEALAAQAAVSVTNAQLREARENFVATAAHEIGNQLTSVRLAAGLLADGVKGADAETSIQQIIASTEESRRLLRDLMSLVRIEQGELELTLEPCPVRDLLEDVVMQMSDRAEMAGRRIALGEVADIDVKVKADAGRMRQILLNLFSNAIKCGGGTVEAGARPIDHAKVEVYVADEGPGIPPEAHERIFEPWVGSTRGKAQGLVSPSPANLRD